MVELARILLCIVPANGELNSIASVCLEISYNWCFNHATGVNANVMRETFISTKIAIDACSAGNSSNASMTLLRPFFPQHSPFFAAYYQELRFFCVCICNSKWFLLQKLIEIANWIAPRDFDTGHLRNWRNFHALFTREGEEGSFNHQMQFERKSRKKILESKRRLDHI